MIFCFVRETKQLTLEEIDRRCAPDMSYEQQLTHIVEVFSVPTREFLAYETKTWLPYFIKRHVLRRNIPKPPPLIEKEEKAESEFSN